MVTLVGTQTNFIDAIKELVELDYEAVEAYEAAVNRLEDEDYKHQLQEFKNDHHSHIFELSEALNKNNHTPPTGPSAKQFLTQGKVVLANLFGDKAILRAMRSNEVDTNTAYERIVTHKDIHPDFEAIVQKGLADEKRHKAWLEKTIGS